MTAVAEAEAGAGARRLASCLSTASARRAFLALCLLTGFTGAPVWAAPLNVVLAAQYQEPTDRYNHAVLGDAAEWGALLLQVDTCAACANLRIKEVVIRLPESRVFEDIAPRLIDLDFDGASEVVVIESDARLGARLAIYDGDGLVTATPFIGTRYRWLAPLGAADLDGDGLMELAYIDRPHLAKTLRVWRYSNRSLTEIASLEGLTNHKIGEDFISGGIRECGAGPEIITADASWQTVMATRMIGSDLKTRKIAPFLNPDSLKSALRCR